MSDDEHPTIPTAARAPADPLLSIGVFARRSRLSPKALRLYERLGLLTPARVDRDNGYRRYRESQLAIARLVAELRRLDMPLARVAEVVAAVGPRGAEVARLGRPGDRPAAGEDAESSPGARGAALVAAYWEAVERRVASQRALADHLRIRLSGGRDPGGYEMYEIDEREVPEQLVLTEQRHVVVDELPAWIEEAMTRLLSSAQRYGGIAGPPSVIYHGEVNQDSDGPVEVCVPIDHAHAAATEAAIRREPAHRAAFTRITKAQVAFPQILSAYDAVAAWIDQHGRTVAGSPREVYFADWAAAGPDDEVCDIAFPVQ